jgi:hypothetical protein
MVAVAAIIFDVHGRILLGKHTYRKRHPWGILAGNLEYGEDPEISALQYFSTGDLPDMFVTEKTLVVQIVDQLGTEN